MSYKTIQLSAVSPSTEDNNNDDVLFSPFHHTNFAEIDEDDANFFNFGNGHAVDSRGSIEDGKSSQLATGFNFVNSIVGAGIIGIPVAIKECGLFMGILLLILVAYLVDQSVILLIECGTQARRWNFEDLCKHLLGSTGYNICVVSMLLFAYGAMLAYLVIIGDTVPIALDYFFGSSITPSRNVVIIVCAVVPILPLSLMRNLSSLSYTSLLSITADVLLVLFILVRGPAAAKEEGTTFRSSEDVKFLEYQLFEGIGTMSFAFVCHHNTFLVYNSMRNANLRRWKKVSHASIFSSFVLCLIMGLGGFLSFGSHTEGDILNNFADNGTILACSAMESYVYSRLIFYPFLLIIDRLILCGRLLLAATMVFTYPLECFVARHSLSSLIQLHAPGFMKPTSSRRASVDSEDARQQVDAIDDIVMGIELEEGNIPEAEQNMTLKQHVLFTLLLWGSSLLLSLVVTDLHIILALTGAVAASCLAYILPALLYLKTYEAYWVKARAGFDPTSNHYQPDFFRRVRKLRRFIFPFFLLIFGILSLVIGVGTVVFDIINK